MSAIIMGHLDVASGTSDGSVVATVGGALGVEFGHQRFEDATGIDYYRAHAVGLVFHLAVTRDGQQHSYRLSYTSDDDTFVSGADLVSIDFHLIRLLSAAGLSAQQTA